MSKWWMKLILVLSVIFGLSGIIMIFVDALTIQNVFWGWISLICLIIGILGIIASIVLVIIDNKDKIKEKIAKYK